MYESPAQRHERASGRGRTDYERLLTLISGDRAALERPDELSNVISPPAQFPTVLAAELSRKLHRDKPARRAPARAMRPAEGWSIRPRRSLQAGERSLGLRGVPTDVDELGAEVVDRHVEG